MAHRKFFRTITASVFLIFLCGCGQEEFALGKITSTLIPQNKWKIPPPTGEELQRLKQILSQPYRFLGKGAQAFAFESPDKKYVLKFFKMRRFTPSFQDYLCPHVVRRRLKNLNWVFNGYKTAYEEFREDTGLIFIHLTKTNFLNQKITLIDEQGVLHRVDLDKTEFVLQEKAELLFNRLKDLRQRGDLFGVEKGITAVLDLVKRRVEKGYADRDKAVSNNYGFVGDRVIQLDIGRLYKGVKPGQIEHVEQRIERWKRDQLMTENLN